MPCSPLYFIIRSHFKVGESFKGQLATLLKQFILLVLFCVLNRKVLLLVFVQLFFCF